jgi:hypothetical protein
MEKDSFALWFFLCDLGALCGEKCSWDNLHKLNALSIFCCIKDQFFLVRVSEVLPLSGHSLYPARMSEVFRLPGSIIRGGGLPSR